MMEICLFTVSADEIEINVREAARYLGATVQKNREAYLATLAELEALVPEVRAAMTPRACFTKLPATVSGGALRIGDIDLISRSLAINLKNCASVYLFAATVGLFADRMISKYARTSPAKSVMCDALFSAAVEGLCERLERELAEREFPARFRPRFSAGYGDLDLSVQREIISLLSADKKIGVTLTGSLQMTPSKSVTAFLGVNV